MSSQSFVIFKLCFTGDYIIPNDTGFHWIRMSFAIAEVKRRCCVIKLFFCASLRNWIRLRNKIFPFVFPLVVVAFVYFKKPIWLSGESDGHVSRRQALEAKTTSNVSLFSVFLCLLFIKRLAFLNRWQWIGQVNFLQNWNKVSVQLECACSAEKTPAISVFMRTFQKLSWTE